jgi:hypothetical protein
LSISAATEFVNQIDKRRRPSCLQKEGKSAYSTYMKGELRYKWVI